MRLLKSRPLLPSNSHPVFSDTLRSPKTATFLEKPVCVNPNQPHGHFHSQIASFPSFLDINRWQSWQSEWNASSLICRSWWKDMGRNFLQLHSWVKQPLWIYNDLSFPHFWRPALLQHPCERPFLLIALRLCISCIQSANENSFLVLLQGKSSFLRLPFPICTSGHPTFWTFLSYGRFT